MLKLEEALLICTFSIRVDGEGNPIRTQIYEAAPSEAFQVVGRCCAGRADCGVPIPQSPLRLRDIASGGGRLSLSLGRRVYVEKVNQDPSPAAAVQE